MTLLSNQKSREQRPSFNKGYSDERLPYRDIGDRPQRRSTSPDDDLRPLRAKVEEDPLYAAFWGLSMFCDQFLRHKGHVTDDPYRFDLTERRIYEGADVFEILYYQEEFTLYEIFLTTSWLCEPANVWLRSGQFRSVLDLLRPNPDDGIRFDLMRLNYRVEQGERPDRCSFERGQ